MQVWKILGSGVVLGTAAIAGQPAPLLAQTAPTIAANPAATEVNRVTVTPTATGISLSLSTTGTQAPQAFSTNLDKVWVTDLIGARLNLPEGKSFSQPSPAPGIASIAVSQVSENGVRIVVTGSDRPPLVTNSSRNGGSLQFELSTQASAAPVLSPSTQSQCSTHWFSTTAQLTSSCASSTNRTGYITCSNTGESCSTAPRPTIRSSTTAPANPFSTSRSASTAPTPCSRTTLG